MIDGELFDTGDLVCVASKISILEIIISPLFTIDSSGVCLEIITTGARNDVQIAVPFHSVDIEVGVTREWRSA